MSRDGRSTRSPTRASTCRRTLNHEIGPARYDGDEAVLLTAEVQAEYARRYGGEGDTAPLDTAEFDAPNGAFFLVRVDGTVAGMGGWRRHGSDAEIKRMYVRPAFQRHGLARALLAHLEETAAAAGISRLILETGLGQPEAVALYSSAGYTDVEPFGHYVWSPLSVHLGKHIGGGA